MKTLTGLLLAAALIAVAAPALSNPKVDEIVVTAKQPAAEMLSDMTDEIVAETSAELHANQLQMRGARHTVEKVPAPAASK